MGRVRLETATSCTNCGARVFAGLWGVFAAWGPWALLISPVSIIVGGLIVPGVAERLPRRWQHRCAGCQRKRPLPVGCDKSEHRLAAPLVQCQLLPSRRYPNIWPI